VRNSPTLTVSGQINCPLINPIRKQATSKRKTILLNGGWGKPEILVPSSQLVGNLLNLYTHLVLIYNSKLGAVLVSIQTGCETISTHAGFLTALGVVFCSLSWLCFQDFGALLLHN
jgi:hypothetical protein